MTVLIYAAVAAVAVFLGYRWVSHRPALVTYIPPLAGVILAVLIFIGFVSLVRPVSQLETLIALALGGAVGTFVWWKLRGALRPWLLSRRDN